MDQSLLPHDPGKHTWRQVGSYFAVVVPVLSVLQGAGVLALLHPALPIMSGRRVPVEGKAKSGAVCVCVLHRVGSWPRGVKGWKQVAYTSDQAIQVHPLQFSGMALGRLQVVKS
jgi:hypothetical protein